MRVKESKELNELATLSGKPAKQVSDIIVSELLNKKIIEETPDNWGCPISDCYERDITVVEIAGVIRAIGINVVKSVHLDALLECVLIGDGDCPECGGEMEVTDGEYKQTGGDGYITPPEYTPIWEETTCTHCGYKESNETELLTIKIKVMALRLRVNEAIARSEANGKKVLKKDIAARLFEGASESAQQVNMTNLCNGTTKRIVPEWVVIICEMCGCSADYLFGMED